MTKDDDGSDEPEDGADAEKAGSINDPLTHTEVEAPRVPFESDDD